tara:strand:+ start:4199 stop:4870 length:672 start_codon:yes stop_codon:yes gene_type:complete
MRIYDVPLVFFDLDDSLINKDAHTLWIRWRARRERWAVVEAIWAYLSLYRAYKQGRITHGRLSAYYRARTRGMTVSDYARQVACFYQERGQLHIYRQAASLLFAYRRQGTRMVLITGADEVVANEYARALGMDDVISNRLLVQGNRITGLTTPLCYGQGKVDLARQYVSESGMDLHQAAFYSDSHSDLPLLEAVGQPVVLNPDTLLVQAANDRNWPVLDWRGA